MSESSCVEQSLFRVALLALVMPDKVLCEFPYRCPEPPVQHKALMQRRPQIAAQVCFSHVGLLLKREEGSSMGSISELTKTH